MVDKKIPDTQNKSGASTARNRSGIPTIADPTKSLRGKVTYGTVGRSPAKAKSTGKGTVTYGTIGRKAGKVSYGTIGVGAAKKKTTGSKAMGSR